MPAVTLCHWGVKAIEIVTASAPSLNLVVLGCEAGEELGLADRGLLDPSGDTWEGAVADEAYASV